jgi:hypothetical protein
MWKTWRQKYCLAAILPALAPQPKGLTGNILHADLATPQR